MFFGNFCPRGFRPPKSTKPKAAPVRGCPRNRHVCGFMCQRLSVHQSSPGYSRMRSPRRGPTYLLSRGFPAGGSISKFFEKNPPPTPHIPVWGRGHTPNRFRGPTRHPRISRIRPFFKIFEKSPSPPTVRPFWRMGWYGRSTSYGNHPYKEARSLVHGLPLCPFDLTYPLLMYIQTHDSKGCGIFRAGARFLSQLDPEKVRDNSIFFLEKSDPPRISYKISYT